MRTIDVSFIGGSNLIFEEKEGRIEESEVSHAFSFEQTENGA
jgi:hypothetical protein